MKRSRPFFGRERELSLLCELLDERVATVTVIKGRRRIGKSRLIEEFTRNHRHLIITGLAPEEKIAAQDQRRHFVNQLERQLNLQGLRADDWDHLFGHLAAALSSSRVILVFDEINWMGSKDPTFLPKLKSAWDTQFSKNPQLILILSGSMSAWIEENILGSTGFFGRITLELTLDELSLPQCTHFWGTQRKRVSDFEIFKVLSVTGGIPRYLELIRPRMTAEENIERLCFRREGILFNEFDRIFSDLFSRRSETYKKIVESLTYGTADQEAILKWMGYTSSSGVISHYLEELVETGYLARDYTWHIKTGRRAKLSHYRLRDNYLRFYLRYIEPNRDAIQRAGSIRLPHWTTIMGLQFENLVLNHRRRIYELIGIEGTEIVYDNPFFLRPTGRQRGCQIDLLIQVRFNTLYLCEIKFSQSAIGASIIREVEEKIEALNLPRGFSVRPLLIQVNGVTEAVEESGFFARIIDFGEIIHQVPSFG